MKKTLLLSFFALGATAFAAGNTYKVTIDHDSVVEGKTLKAGGYKVSVENGNAVFTRGSQTVEVPAVLKTEPNKNPTTVMTYESATDLHEIRVGGTHTHIILEGAEPIQPGQ